MAEFYIIKQKGSIVISSIIDFLRANGYVVTEINGEKAEIRSTPIQEEDSIIIYAETNLAVKTEAVIAVKDKIIETKAHAFIIEGDDGYTFIKGFIPDELITQKFTHPLDAKNIGMAMLRHMEVRRTKGRKKIMVVDDSTVMLTLAKNWLEDKYDVTLANSGAMAIKYLSLDRPDLVLLDYEMPIVSGKTVFQMIRSEPDFANVPVIFLTAQNDKKMILEVLELKPEGYLLKSMEPYEIIRTVDNYFLKHSSMY